MWSSIGHREKSSERGSFCLLWMGGEQTDKALIFKHTDGLWCLQETAFWGAQGRVTLIRTVNWTESHTTGQVVPRQGQARQTIHTMSITTSGLSTLTALMWSDKDMLFFFYQVTFMMTFDSNWFGSVFSALRISLLIYAVLMQCFCKSVSACIAWMLMVL